MDKNKMDTDAILKAIFAILGRGNNVEIRKKGDGLIILEVEKEIKYSTPA